MMLSRAVGSTGLAGLLHRPAGGAVAALFCPRSRLLCPGWLNQAGPALVPEMWDRACAQRASAPPLGRAVYRGYTAGCGGCLYLPEAQREEPRGVFISTAKAEKENVQNSGSNLHEKLRKCHHYSLMYSMA